MTLYFSPSHNGIQWKWESLNEFQEMFCHGESFWWWRDADFSCLFQRVFPLTVLSRISFSVDSELPSMIYFRVSALLFSSLPALFNALWSWPCPALGSLGVICAVNELMVKAELSPLWLETISLDGMGVAGCTIYSWLGGKEHNKLWSCKKENKWKL